MVGFNFSAAFNYLKPKALLFRVGHLDVVGFFLSFPIQGWTFGCCWPFSKLLCLGLDIWTLLAIF